jgi:hypothetical protein
MPRCCGSASCACVIEAGAHIVVDGIGSPADPFVIVGDVGVVAKDNTVFDITVTGLGTAAVPWQVEANYAATAKLNDLPDVNAPSPTNTQVLSWDTATSQWIARAPTTAAAGSVTHDTSLLGDGSGATPLQINEDPARMLATAAGGLGLSDTGMNSIVRRFADTAARTAATPAPVQNALTMLGTNPGQIDYWTGTAWLPAGVFLLAMTGQEMYALSGSFTGAQRVTYRVQNVQSTTDSNGEFDVLSPADLSGKAGVLTVTAQPFQPTGGPTAITMPYVVMLAPINGGIRGVAFRLDDGQPLGSSAVAVTVTALLY